MKEFRQSKTFKPYRTIAPLPVISESGQLEIKTLHYSWRMGYMSQNYKADLFRTARGSLEPGNEDSARKLSDMANYLTTINVEDFSWMVGSDIHKDPEIVQRAMQRMQSPEDEPHDAIHQRDAIRYSRFGNSMLQLVRVPTAEHDSTYNPMQLPMSLEIECNRGPEMLWGTSETIIRTIYPLPPSSEY
jgi:hypothetical protein